MAIIIEEGKKKTNILGIAAWIAILLIVGAAIYYIFFAAPELVVIPTSSSLDTIAPIAQLSLHADAVTNSTAFQSLHSTISDPVPTGPAGVGRSNPFIAP